MMRELKWSPAEKKAAKGAFDLAYERELRAVRLEVEAMLQRGKDDQVVWEVENYLRKKRREMDEKYDYRYSVLMMVFLRLLHEGWLAEEDLAGLSADKLEWIKRSGRIFGGN
jgi:hypothetical protein